jgi:hypothetical protein
MGHPSRGKACEGLTVIRRLDVENDYKNNPLRSTYN